MHPTNLWSTKVFLCDWRFALYLHFPYLRFPYMRFPYLRFPVLAFSAPSPNSHRPPARQDKTVLSVSCLVCRCELHDCSERVPTSNSPSATVSSYREFDSYHRSGRDADKTVSSCLAWRCEIASKQRKWRAVTSQSEALLIARAAVRGLYYRRRHTKHCKI